MDFKEGREHENYLQMVLEDERYDNQTKKHTGEFYLDSSFTMVVLTNNSDDQ